MDKFEVIKNFLLDESVSPEIRRERFEIAWDIRNSLDEIKKLLRRKVFESVVGKLRNIDSFKDYKKIDKGFLKGEKHKGFIIYKESWVVHDEPIIGYAIEMDLNNFYNIYYGIIKQNDKNPFNGKRTSTDLSKELKNILYALQGILNNWKVGDWWIFWKYFDGFYALRDLEDEYEFYVHLISSNTLQEGINSLANYYVQKLEELKELTENYLDEFVRLIKTSYGKNTV
jgi:hypothetical protein